MSSEPRVAYSASHVDKTSGGLFRRGKHVRVESILLQASIVAAASCCGGGCESAGRSTDGSRGGGGSTATHDAGGGSPHTGGARTSQGGRGGSLLEDDAGILPRDAIPFDGPTYMGSVSNGPACATTYRTTGHAPSGAGPFPLFLYFVGTEFVPGAASDAHDSPAAMAVTEAMARRGFVALSVEYDNDVVALLSDHQNQLSCLFDAGRAASLIAGACGLATVDCGLGVGTWGHSQGALVAVVAHDWDARVRAAWATGYGGDGGPGLDVTRLRVVNGEADATDNGTATKLQGITGLDAARCPNPDACLRADGSGYVIVRARDLANPGADAGHCWFDRATCAGELMLEPNWIDPSSNAPFALAPNADWLADAATR